MICGDRVGSANVTIIVLDWGLDRGIEESSQLTVAMAKGWKRGYRYSRGDRRKMIDWEEVQKKVVVITLSWHASNPSCHRSSECHRASANRIICIGDAGNIRPHVALRSVANVKATLTSDHSCTTCWNGQEPKAWLIPVLRSGCL